MVLTDPADIEGLPESILKAAAASHSVDNTDEENLSLASGPWSLTLESESIDIISKWTLLKHIKSRRVRQSIFHAYRL